MVIYLVTQLLLAAMAIAGVVWAVTTNRRMRQRIPLSFGIDPRHVLLALAWFLLLVPVLYLVFANELVPRGSPVLFASAMVLLSVATVGCMMASVSLAQMRMAKGWLSLIDDETLLLEADGAQRRIVLTPGSVRVAAIEGKPQWLQFTIVDGDAEVSLFAMVKITDLGLAGDGPPVQRKGMMLAYAGKFCDVVRPFVLR